MYLKTKFLTEINKFSETYFYNKVNQNQFCICEFLMSSFEDKILSSILRIQIQFLKFQDVNINIVK